MCAAVQPRLEPVAFSVLPGWHDDAVEECWPILQRAASAVALFAPELRPASSASSTLREALAATLAVPAHEARAFLEAHWRPHRIAVPTRGFVTAYYEPRVDGALVSSDRFKTPILARPDDLGSRDPYPDRRAIVAGAIASRTRPVVWLQDAVEVFLIQVQGSARVVLPDGEELRLVYDGRNGRSYTSIGRLLTERGAIVPDAMSLAALKAWLRAHGAGTGGIADEVMNANESYVFFRAEPVADRAVGPTGGQGLPLTPLRSIAVDRTLWPYGLPFWIDAAVDAPGAAKFPRLMIAQDTGSAIVGPARADLFFGSGEVAGAYAGRVRHPADMTVLLPKGFAAGDLAA